MLLLKEGFPKEDSLVLCTITGIHYHSVFAKLDEYGKTGLIHISEISPGRIRNIRDFVSEGKKVVCKVLRIDRSKGHIDLSLRRVNENQKRIKINEIKQEQKAEKIVELVAKENKKDFKEFYKEVSKNIFDKYDDLATGFKEAVKNPQLLEKLGISKKVSDQLLELIKVRFKEEDVVIGGTIKLESYEPTGLEIIKKALLNAEDSSDKVSINYGGGGSYNINVTSKKYKEAEKILEKAVKKALVVVEKGLGVGEFIRKE